MGVVYIVMCLGSIRCYVCVLVVVFVGLRWVVLVVGGVGRKKGGGRKWERGIYFLVIGRG